jgi:hypothetical protein
MVLCQQAYPYLFAHCWCAAVLLHMPQVRAKYGDDWERISRMSIIEDGAQGDK